MTTPVGLYTIITPINGVVGAATDIGFEWRVKSRDPQTGAREALVGSWGSPLGSVGQIRLWVLRAGVWMMGTVAPQNIAILPLVSITNDSIFGVIEPLHGERFKMQTVGSCTFVDWWQQFATHLELEILDYVGP